MNNVSKWANLFAAYHIIGTTFFVVMGAPIGLIIFSILIIPLNFEAIRIEKILVKKFGEKYQLYQKQVPKRIYSLDILCILIINYGLLIIGIIGLVFFPQL